jgi:hypothetical protein
VADVERNPGLRERSKVESLKFKVEEKRKRKSRKGSNTEWAGIPEICRGREQGLGKRK